MSPENNAVLSKPYYSFNYASAILHQFSIYYCKAKSFIYDVIILRMTEKWYRAVLERVDDGSIVLDVGVGTGGALLRCRDLVTSKNLKVIGIDIDAAYVEAGKLSIQDAGLADRISIDLVDFYQGSEAVLDLAKQMGVTPDAKGGFVDAVYFSGSFSLLPDPVNALKLASTMVKEKGDGNKKGAIYITQTYQRKTPFFLPYVKPLLKYATTIDFGQLIREEDVLKTFGESELEVVQHQVIPGSVDTRFQAAYLSILR
eukprot:CCRYP_005196-RA/>CCRYP_005196-RA protein AED:0.00 eAED:0.00 QI:186/1/1/1/1/1/2/265/256